MYRARDLKLGRDVALKILPPNVASDADSLARFDREVAAGGASTIPTSQRSTAWKKRPA